MVSKNINSRLILTHGEREKWDKLTLGASEVSIDDVVVIDDVFSDSFFEDVSCEAFEDAEPLVAEITISCCLI